LRRDQKAWAAAPAGAYGQFNFWAVAFAGCFNIGRESLAFGPCADAEVGVTSAKGFGVSQSLPADTLWSALGAGGYAAISLGRHLGLPLHLDVLAPYGVPSLCSRMSQSEFFRPRPLGFA